MVAGSASRMAALKSPTKVRSTEVIRSSRQLRCCRNQTRTLPFIRRMDFLRLAGLCQKDVKAPHGMGAALTCASPLRSVCADWHRKAGRTCRLHRYLLISSCAHAAGRLRMRRATSTPFAVCTWPARKLEPLDLLCAGGIRIAGRPLLL
jgi:hypothetical protein